MFMKNRRGALSQTGCHSAIATAATSIFPILYFKLQTKQNKNESRMGSSYSGDYIARDHKHSDITISNNIEEPQQKYRIETVSNRFSEDYQPTSVSCVVYLNIGVIDKI